uniref:Smr domain-containing protein n=1 Tax=Strombidium rassoulzadegani TaxID=1082188 RepID=A0A7S3CVV6_9SPIT|mmetsp:Transcript_9648/g.16202  ORF Transcript_9648/g.16202 Transcript_9648/m.16202 type:complete len:136 (+) Transcript_9648:2243-2650(+)
MNKERLKVMFQINELKEEKKKILSSAELQVFTHLNNEGNIFNYIDLHGQKSLSAWNIVKDRLLIVQQELDKGSVVPNVKDGRNHVFKIICGAGKHSQHGAVLKHKINDLLASKGLDFYPIMEHGTFLVHFQKSQL